MKKTVILCLVIVSLITNTSYSQKIDLDRETWSHNIVRLPKSKDLASLKTYSIFFYADADNLNRIGLSPAKIEPALKLDGYVYTKEPADIVIEIIVENFKKISEEVRTQEQTVYEGGKNVTRKTYLPVTAYSIPTKIKISTSADQQVVVNSVIGAAQNPVVIGSGEYPTPEAANAQFKGTDDKRLESFKEKYFTLLSTELNAFREKYDFGMANEKDVFWHVDLKKNPEYAEFNDKLKTAKDLFAGLSPTEDVKSAREKFAPVMQYLRENADKLSGDDKKNRKLKYAYLLNLGKIQLWLDMIDEAAMSAQQVIDNDYDKSDGKTLLRSVNALKEELKNSPNGSRYLNREGFASAARFSFAEIKTLQSKPAPVVASTQASLFTPTGNNAQQVEPAPRPAPRPTLPPPTQEQIKKDLDLAFAHEFAESVTGGSIILAGDYVYDQDHKLTGRKFIWGRFPERNKMTNEGTFSVYYYSNELGGALFESGCQTVNNTINGFTTTYDAQNRVTKISGSWARRGGSTGKLVQSAFTFTYNENRIVKIEKSEITGEGAIKNPTVVSESVERIAAIDWKSDNELTVSYTGLVRPKKGPQQLQPAGKKTFKVSAGSLYTELVGTDNSKRTEEVLGSGNQMTRTVVDGASKLVWTFTLGPQGKVEKVVFTTSENNQLKSTTETTVKYELTDTKLPADNLCNYKYKNINNIYDASGTLIQESTDTQIRKRNPDGTWGPWQNFTY